MHVHTMHPLGTPLMNTVMYSVKCTVYNDNTIIFIILGDSLTANLPASPAAPTTHHLPTSTIVPVYTDKKG
jgi:hypothetical protein